MKYVNQLDYEHIPYPTRTKLTGEKFEKGKSTTVRTSGCGLCSAVMVADRLLPNTKFGLEEALSISYESEANYAVGTSYKRFVPLFAQKLGLEYENARDSEALIHCLQTGGATVILVNGDKNGAVGIFSHVEHYIVAIGIEKDGRIAILDPAYKEGKFEEEGRRGKVEMKNDVIALTHLQTLEEDTFGRALPFWLFWRA